VVQLLDGGIFRTASPDASEAEDLRVRRIVYADNLPGALTAAGALAVMVTLIELTAGLPALFTQIRSAIAVITLSRRKVQERPGRVP
jgi:hypothetical protein